MTRRSDLGGQLRASGRRGADGTLTFLFTDLVDSTAIGARIGDQAVQDVLRTQARIVRDAVQAHGGHVVRSSGDGFLVTFTSALQAVTCAVAVQRTLSGYNQVHAERPIQLRIGLHCGEAIREKGDYYGAAVNAAARICGAATGGQVLVSSLLMQMVSALGPVEFADRGEHELKGFPAPWRLYEVALRDASSTASVLTRALAELTPFVGRQAELAEAKRLVESARAGRGGVAVVAGEPGLGKTRLAGEIAAYAADRELTVATGHCHESGDAPPYGPFIEALEPLVRGTRRPTLSKMLGADAPWIAKMLPAVADKLPDLPPAPELPPEQQRHFMLSSVVAFCLAAARRRPLLLILEDLHWSDLSTELLLRRLAREVGDAPLALVATYRDVEVDADHPLLATLTELHRRRYFRPIALRPFGREEVRQMLLGLARDEPPEALVDAIHRETEGNPFFVEEFVKLLVEEGRLFDEVGSWRPTLGAEAIAIPRGVSLIIDRRLRHLATASRSVLSTASVIGRRFRFDVLQRAAGRDAEGLLAAIDDAERAHLVHGTSERGGALFRFAHELISQTLYRELSVARRQRLHLRVADAIEETFPSELTEHAVELAHHCRKAGGECAPDRTRRYLLLAGDQAMRASAFERALEHYLEARDTEPRDPLERADLAFRLGAARRSAGAWDEATREWNDAAQAYESLAESEKAERAFYALSMLHGWRGQFPDAMQMVQRGLMVSPASHSEPRARLLAMAGTMLALGGEVSGADALIGEAAAIAEGRGDRALLGWVLAIRGLRQGISADFHEQLATLSRAEELLRASADVFSLSQCMNYRAQGLGYLGRFAEMDPYLDELGTLAERLGDASSIAMHALLRGIIAVARGRFTGARGWAEVAEKQSRESAVLILPAALHLVAMVDFLAGEGTRTEDLVTEAARLHAKMGNPAHRYEGPASVLYYRASAGDAPAAEKYLAELGSIEPPGEPLTASAFDAGVLLSASLAQMGRGAQAAAFYPLLERGARSGVVFAGTTFPSLQRVLGMVAAANGWWDRAAEHYERALADTASAGARKETAETCYWNARLLRQRGRPDDGGRAGAMLDRAIAAYAEIGMRRQHARAASERAAL